jgi:hypothetical protein
MNGTSRSNSCFAARLINLSVMSCSHMTRRQSDRRIANSPPDAFANLFGDVLREQLDAPCAMFQAYIEQKDYRKARIALHAYVNDFPENDFMRVSKTSIRWIVCR